MTHGKPAVVPVGCIRHQTILTQQKKSFVHPLKFIPDQPL
jgi:hypothetical protein